MRNKPTATPEHSPDRRTFRTSPDGKWRIILCRDLWQWIIQRHQGPRAKTAWIGISFCVTCPALIRDWQRRTGLCDDFADLLVRSGGTVQRQNAHQSQNEAHDSPKSHLALTTLPGSTETACRVPQFKAVAEALGLTSDPTPSQVKLLANAHSDNLAGMLDAIRIEHLRRLLTVAATRDRAASAERMEVAA